VIFAGWAAATACGNRSTPHLGNDGPADSIADISPDAYEPKELVAFSFTRADNPSLAADVTARISGRAIVADLPAGTDTTSLVATWTTTGVHVTVNGATQVSAVTPNDFRRTLKYAVVASDNSTAIYMVTVALPAAGFGSAALFDGKWPDDIVAQDFDGDGAPEIVLAETLRPETAVFANTTALGATTASFAPAMPFTTPTNKSAGSVAIADFNDDGRPDFAATDDLNQVFVWLNTTPSAGMPPTFGSPDSYAADLSVGSVRIADINRDGRPDMVVTSGNLMSVEVFLNTTPPGATSTSFAPLASFPIGQAAGSIAFADFDGDGVIDLATANPNANTLTVLVNTTPGGATTASFAPEVHFAAPSLPRDVKAEDINGDGKPDLLVATNDGAAVAVLLNTTPAAGQPSFATPVLFATDICPLALAAPDINADGKPDIVTGNDCPSTVSVLLNTTVPGSTTPTFSPHVELAAAPNPRAVTFADVNGDNLVDLLVAEYGNGTVFGGASVLLGQ